MNPAYIIREYEDGYLAASEDFKTFYKLEPTLALKPKQRLELAGVLSPETPFFDFHPLAMHPDSDVYLLGIPYGERSLRKDSKVRLFVEHLRTYSSIMNVYPRLERERTNSGLYSLDEEEQLFSNLRFEDLGNLDIESNGLMNLASIVQHVHTAGRLLFSIGGDHSITYELLKSITEVEKRKIILIQFDAHLDCGTSPILPMEVNHSNFVRHLLEESIIARALQLGVRGIRSPGQVWKDERIKRLHPQRMNIETISKILEQYQQDEPDAVYYLSFDIDCLDPSVFPYVDFPVQGGPSLQEIRILLREIFHRLPRVVGVDLVEGQGTLIDGRIPQKYESALRLFAYLLDGIASYYQQLSRTCSVVEGNV